MSRNTRILTLHAVITIALSAAILTPQASWAARLKSASPGRQGGIPTAGRAGDVPTTGAHTGPLSAPRLAVDEEYHLSPGDVVQVSVYGEPAHSGAFVIGPAGTIAMPVLGQMPLRGLTLHEAEEFLTARLGTIIRRPSVTVTVNELASVRKVYVTGEVTTVGALSLPFGSTLTDALAAVGPGPAADLRRIRLTHPGGKPVEVDCSGLRGEGPLGTEHRLEYGDRILVPRVREEVTILGEVRAPGSVFLPVGQEVTVLDALRMSQGFTPLANRSRAVLLRPGSDPISIDLGRLLSDGDIAQNRLLQGGDVLVVHRAGSIGVVGQVAHPAVFQATTDVPIIQALAQAGGPLSTGDLSQAEIIRDGKTIFVDLQAFLDRGEAPAQLTLRPGDVLVIPRGVGQDVLVMGAVMRPGITNLRGAARHDLLRIVTLSSPTPLADLSRVTIYRGSDTIVRDLEALMDEGAVDQNIDLQAGDMVMVPPKSVDSILITGAVLRRGMVQVVDEKDHDLLRIVTLAGAGAASDLSRVAVHRGDETIVRNLKAVVDDGRLEESMQVRDGDIIVVPTVEDSVVLTGALMRGGVVRLYEGVDRDLLALVFAGGPTLNADLERVAVVRDGLKTIRNLKALIEDGDKSQTLEILPGDVINVPAVEVHTVLVTGAVTRAGLVDVADEHRRDLARLVTVAGPLPGADLTRVRVHRAGMATIRDIKAFIDTGLPEHTLQLEDGDVVVVPAGEHTVLVMGAVGLPGAFQFSDDRQRDLVRMILASGPTPYANLRLVRVHRKDQVLLRDVYAYIYEGDRSQTLLLEDDDIVVVPMHGSTVMVSGAVMRSGPVSVQDPEQSGLVQVVMSAGPLPSADLARVTVYRGDSEEIHDLSGLREEGQLPPDIALLPGDRVLVPALNPTTVLVTGAVMQQGTLELITEEQRDLAKALVMAAPLPTADWSRITVHRGVDTLVRNVKAYLEEGDQTQTLVLEDGDRILVPGQGGQAILMTGELRLQGPLPTAIGQTPDLLGAVILSGPMTATADLGHVAVYRNGERLVRDLVKLQEEGDLSQNLSLAPGDIVFVPKATDTVVFMGEVTRPGAVNIYGLKQRDLAHLLPTAAPTEDADLGRITIYREGETIVADCRAMMEEGDLSQNIELIPGDLVYVPPDDVHNVMVVGALSRTGEFNVRNEADRDLLRIITLLTPLPDADLSRVTIYRDDNEPIYCDLQRLMDQGDLTQTTDVVPGDVIVVPKLGAVYVLGSVGKPGAYVMQPGWGLLDAISAAGHIRPGGLWIVNVIRRRPDGTHEHINVPITGIATGKPPEPVKLKAGDILYIPYGKSKKKLSWRTIRDALWSVSSAVNVYRDLDDLFD